MIEEDLKKIGFSKNLSTVYLTLLKLGKAKAGEIIKQSGLQRSVVYSALDELIKRELISKVEKNNIAIFSLNDPENLIKEAKEKEEKIKQTVEEIKKWHAPVPREVTVSEGLEAIMRATDRSLLAPKGETMYVLGVPALNVQPKLDKHWHEHYHKIRMQRGINFKGLYDRSVDQTALDYRNNMPGSEAKYMPEGLEMPVWFNICVDIVSIMVPCEDPPLVFTIKSRPTAEAIKKYFDYFWSRGTKRK